MVISRLKQWFLLNFGTMGYLKPGIKCNHEWFGGRYGGFYLHPDLLTKQSIVYSFGIGEDISFDEEVIRRFSCRVYGFDPTPKTIGWLQGRQIPAGFHFSPIGIARASGGMEFFLPKNPAHVSGSVHSHPGVNQQERIIVPVKTLQDILLETGHPHVDVLKMDIEGSEYEVIDQILSTEVPIKQLLIEFHSRFFDDGEEKTKAAVCKLKANGYEIFAVSDILQEVSFIHRSVRLA